ncbi:sulfatase [Alicyclobacillus mengziensis]|uniref:Sulfatase n=1 Tax=Alicyclobacillus mengziensis TaxID=2931921 RepID=A0A9X7VZJ9_9BACL|nr:sulfatase [Alicyclobacillus mengziensis]QSO47397.1 sulfatase [Alicyclobacillus mengziensis]
MNVICVLMDTFRRDHMSCYGNPWIQTPNLERFANEGARFENAYIGSYPCMPARQDLWTGRVNFLWRGWSPLEYDQDDLPTLVRQHGTTSMLITDHYHLWQYGSGNYHFGFDGVDLIRGQENDNWITSPDIQIQYPAAPEKLNRNWPKYFRNTAHFRTEEDYFAGQVFQKAMDWVESNKNLEQFFLLIDGFDPHEPFDPPAGYADLYNPGYTGESIVWPRYGPADRFTADEVAQIHALYCGEITYVDHWFGKFHRKLEELGLMKDTMVIVTSDHGFLFGEHNWVGKHARILYEDIARTPLLIQSPEITPGVVYQNPVQMADITPTILQALGIDPPTDMHGKSLIPLWNPQDSTPDGDIRSRSEILFGVFGGPIYCTDGEWVFVKKPVEGNTPLYWYTHSHYNNWNFGQQNSLQDSKDRLQIWDGARFPVQYENARPGHAAPRMLRQHADYTTHVPDALDELYLVSEDPMQERNRIAEGDVANRMRDTLERSLRHLEAPPEQWIRLGLGEHG